MNNEIHASIETLSHTTVETLCSRWKLVSTGDGIDRIAVTSFLYGVCVILAEVGYTLPAEEIVFLIELLGAIE